MEPHELDQEQDLCSLAAPRREPLDSAVFRWGVPLCLLVGTPWYLPQDLATRQYGGLPLWTWISLVSALALAVVTATAALGSWSDEELPDGTADATPDTSGDERLD